jgi:hypothetical protein
MISFPSRIRKADYIHLGPTITKMTSTLNIDADFRKSIGISEDDILLLYVGRLNVTNQPYKGVAAKGHVSQAA